MGCVGCGSPAASERSQRTGQGCPRFHCRACGKQFNGCCQRPPSPAAYTDIVGNQLDPSGMSADRTHLSSQPG